MKKIFKLAVLVLAFLSIPSVAFANSDHTDFSEAEEIINNETPCSELTQDQLQHIGDYYMEQMHPGEEHELMDQMMGGEGSQSLKQMHIAMAKRIYCNQDVTGGTMMQGEMGMMSGAMMNQGSQNFQGMGSRMMGNNWWGQDMMSWFGGLFGLYMILAVVFLGTGIAAFIKYLMKSD